MRRQRPAASRSDGLVLVGANLRAEFARDRSGLLVERLVLRVELPHLRDVVGLRSIDQSGDHVALLVCEIDQAVRPIGNLARRLKLADLVDDRLLERVQDPRTLLDKVGERVRIAYVLLLRAEVLAHRVQLRDVLLLADRFAIAATRGQRCDENAKQATEQDLLLLHALVHTRLRALPQSRSDRYKRDVQTGRERVTS